MTAKTANGVKTQYKYNAGNRLIESVTGAERTKYSYDKVGNLVKKDGAGGSVSYTYNALNLLETWTDGTHTESYTYNASGLLASITTESSTTAFVWDILNGDGQMLTSTTDGETTSYTYGLERISALTGKTRTEYVYDARGSVAAEVSYNAAWYTLGGALSDKTVTSKAYTPFGEQLGEATSGFGFNGEYYNAETGQIYLRARFYEPEMNRFSQKDIIRGSITDGLSLNRYLYCANDPVNFVDPSGESIKSLATTVGRAVSGVVRTASVAKAAVASTVSKVVSTTVNTVSAAKAAAITTAVAVGRSVASSVSTNKSISQTISAASQTAKATIQAGAAYTSKALNAGINEIKQSVTNGETIVKSQATYEMQRVKEAASDVDWQKVGKVAMIAGSTLEVAGGIALTLTGVGSAAGAALIAAGTSSLIGGASSNATGGSYFAGWAGGQISGLITGTGIGLAGNVLSGVLLNTGVSGATIINSLVTAKATAGTIGTIGGFAGSVVYQAIQNSAINYGEALDNGLINGMVAMLATPFTVIPEAIKAAGGMVIAQLARIGIIVSQVHICV